MVPSLLFSEVGFVEPWGKDAEMLHATEREAKEKPPSLPLKIAEMIIGFRQKVLTKVDGPRSSFRPTSSRYMQLAMRRYGFLRGYIMGCDRLLRENDEPWVYRYIQIDKLRYKYDPATTAKNSPDNSKGP